MSPRPFILPGTNIRTLGPPDAMDFYDSQTAQLDRAVTPLEAWNIVMSEPMPILRLAFRIRDAISARFGVRRIGGFSGRRPEAIARGERLDFFEVEEAVPGALVLTARDVHLDVMTCLSVQGHDLTITSSVVTHNWFGRLYMVPVAPAHRVIVRIMLGRVRRATATVA